MNFDKFTDWFVAAWFLLLWIGLLILIVWGGVCAYFDMIRLWNQ